MKCRKWYAAAAFAPVALAAVTLVGLLNLPAAPVTATQTWLGAGGARSTVSVLLANVGAGFDVSDGQYDGWCMEDNHRPNAPALSPVGLYDSTAPVASLPLSFQSKPWDKVNYLLNKKAGTVADVQVAVWVLVGEYDGTFPLTVAALAMIDDAMTNGGGFVPGPGEIVAVLLFNDGIGPMGYQDTLIEVRVPSDGGEGCTPGFWKNHLDKWGPTGLSPDDDFDTTFGVDLFDPNISLYDAVNSKGGGSKKVARHGAAALLNALHPQVNYPFSVAEVIASVQAGDVDDLVVANELGCQFD